MSETIRMNKILKFGVKVCRSEFESKYFEMKNFKDTDILNYIITDWLELKYSGKELSDMGYDELGIK